jgi:hypothetical protein
VTWALTFPDRCPSTQIFAPGQPTLEQVAVARDALADAQRELGLERLLTVAWFTEVYPGSTSLRGYFLPAEPGRVYLRAGMSADETRRTIRHELVHAAAHAWTGSVGDEDVPIRFAWGVLTAHDVRRALGRVPTYRPAS